MKWIIRILVWASLFVIGGFYISSSVGWVIVFYALATRMLEGAGPIGSELSSDFRSFTALDHVIRSLQVLVICVASILMILMRRGALRLVSICLVLGIVATVANPKWTVSFLSGHPGIELLGVVTLFLYALERNGFLH